MTYASDVSGSLLTTVLSSLSQTSWRGAYSMSIAVKVFQAARSGEQRRKL
ncbi:hypothetical protein JG687_00018311 [Phytophthora cactorum]|uniref:Uncharacterized protein n=1 Tax=Phytophthora cactorum TaxID=29920 RepID=A0A8T1TMX9_9STRA|nr:hypothetical protein JG687_00018311 [Phytophthora cactorum]